VIFTWRRLLVAFLATVAYVGVMRAVPAHADPTIAAVGDLACPAWASMAPTRCQQRAVSTYLVNHWPRRVLLMGDTQYPNGALADYRASYAPTYGRLNLAACPVPGNHEYGTAGAAGFRSYFGATPGGRTCNTSTAPNWTIVGLDSGPALGCTSIDCVTQNAYLDAQLARAPTCEIVYWHHPRWSSEAEDSPRVQPWLDTAYRRHADLVLWGHAHNYERFARINPAGAADPNGFRAIIAGTGGVNLRPFDRTPRPTSQVRDATHFGALFVTLHPRSYDVRFISPDGVVRDQILNQPCRA
jgi:hypothetical protein